MIIEEIDELESEHDIRSIQDVDREIEKLILERRDLRRRE